MKKKINTDDSKSMKQLSLLKSIIFVSVFIVILLFSYSFLFLSPSYVKLIEKISEKEAVQIAQHIMKDLLPQKELLTSASLSKDFSEKCKTAANDFNLMKIKLFSHNGKIIFSTSEEEIGAINTKDYFQNIVKKGFPYTKSVQKDARSLEDQIVKVDVVETYVPIMDEKTFLGAFEIYLDTTATRNELEQLLFEANLLIIAISSLLLLAMVFIVTKAKASILARHETEAKILQQSISLQAKNTELSIINAVSDVINESVDLNKLLPDVLERLANKLGPKNDIKGAISLLKDNKLQLECHLGYDEEFIKDHEKRNIEECLCGKVARSGEMIIECGTHSATGPTYCSGTKDRCHIVVPLKSHSNVIGILSLHTPTSLQIGTQEDMLLTISNQLGLAISNIKLFMEAQKHSLIDPLTGLGNRRNLSAHMTRFISEARRHKTPLSLAMADIDHFKRFNDTFGHAKGDEILTKVSQIIKNEIRDIDFVARYGGEEFLILFSKTGLSGAQQACERIRKTVEVDTDVTISIGIASFSLGGTENELMEEADKALYMAKENGRNRVEVAQKS